MNLKIVCFIAIMGVSGGALAAPAPPASASGKAAIQDDSKPGGDPAKCGKAAMNGSGGPESNHAAMNGSGGPESNRAAKNSAGPNAKAKPCGLPPPHPY